MKQVLNIQGLWCSSCEASALRCLERMEGIQQAKVSFVLGAGMIEYDESILNVDDVCQKLDALGYESSPKENLSLNDQDEQLRKHWMRLAVAIFFGMWVMIFQISHYVEPNPYAGLGGLIGCIPILLYSGWPILRIGFRTLIQGTPTLDSLISIAIVASTVLSIPATYSDAEPWWDTVAMLVVILLIGRLVEMKLRRQGLILHEAFDNTLEPEVELLQSGERIPLSKVVKGQDVRLLKDAVIPVDGVMLSERALVDCSSWNGEAKPTNVIKGEMVLAGSIIKSLSCELEVTAVPPERKIDLQLHQAEELLFQRNKHRGFLAVWLPYWIWGTIFLSMLVGLVFWWMGYPIDTVMTRALTVLLISCPCALSIASPSVLHLTLQRFTQQGILLKDPTLIWKLANSTDVYFDKTGTLTCGRPGIVFCSDDSYMPRMSAIELNQPHPYALAFDCDGIESEMLNQIVERETVTARGVQAIVKTTAEDQVHHIGSGKWMSELGVQIPSQYSECNVFYAIDREFACALRIEDALRTEVPKVLDRLLVDRQIHILSGDRQDNVDAILAGIQTDDCIQGFGDLDPSDKVEYIQSEDSIFIGDGINDAMAMGKAQVGISLNESTDIAQKQADVVLENGLNPLPYLFEESNRATKKILQNMYWALFYNVLFIPLAVMGILRPQYALLIMLSSSIVIQINARR